jgi:hypothetical protein
MLVVPATWEVEVEGSQFKASLRKIRRPYLKRKSRALA